MYPETDILFKVTIRCILTKNFLEHYYFRDPLERVVPECIQYNADCAVREKTTVTWL